MTKLEQKLIELGYKRTGNYFKYIKRVLENILIIDINVGARAEIRYAYVDFYARGVYYQWQLDNLQQAFNEMQKDLEVLKQCQS